MEEASKLILSILKGYAPLMALITKISPVVSSQQTEFDFINYTLEEQGPFTKDGVHNYILTIDSWSNSYDNTLKIADAVKQALIQAPTPIFNYNGSKPAFSEEGIYYTSSNYSFKK
ncbi:hypothetical protein ACFQZW_12905 [Lutibacter aestuarii]|uniref:DUF3168 domain-containing protein n=1 Tax=Lutibacter aestuarii TaxID=861111 RepID=A0ABW2Z834_9FLAO